MTEYVSPNISVGISSDKTKNELTGEEMGEFDGEDHCFLEGLLGSLQPCHVTPPHVRLLHHDGTCVAEGK